jgi:hypothetical protein
MRRQFDEQPKGNSCIILQNVVTKVLTVFPIQDEGLPWIIEVDKY